MDMKYFFTILLFFTVFMVYSDDDKSKKFVSVPSDSTGSLLYAENCFGCHSISTFTASKPDEGYVDELAERIDYQIYSPMTGMSHLDFLSFSEIKKIARFLVYGSHIEGWVSEEFHGEIVEETGSDTCMKCHDNDRIKNIEIPSCSECH